MIKNQRVVALRLISPEFWQKLGLKIDYRKANKHKQLFILLIFKPIYVMKKGILFFSALAFVLIFTQCNSVDYSTPSVSGLATLDDGSPAAGAIVSISTEPNAAAVVSTAIADADGNYELFGIAKGTYYISATYNSANTNMQKSMGFTFTTASDYEVTLKKNDSQTVAVELVSNTSDGTAVIDLADGWEWDNTHSMIAFEFPYDVENAPFSGHFGEVGWENLKFDEANPSNTDFTAWVYLPSIETGSPTIPPGHGRDDINGCIMGTFGLELNEADTMDNGYYPEDAAMTDDNTGTGYARIKSKTVSAYGNGYKAICDFTFHGFTKEVTLYFDYIDGFEGEDRSGNPTKFSSLEGFFKFNALADYEIDSGHVGDAEVTVKVSLQFTKTL